MAEERLTLIFTVGGEQYGTDVHMLQSVGPLTPVDPDPALPSFMRGFTEDRRIPVIHLHARLGTRDTPATNESRILYFEVDGMALGAVVDAVHTVLPLEESRIRPLQATDMAEMDDGRLIVLLNLQKILTQHEISMLKEMQP